MELLKIPLLRQVREVISGKNIVLVNIESVEDVQKTYPNYFLSTQKLLQVLSNIVLTGEAGI